MNKRLDNKSQQNAVLVDQAQGFTEPLGGPDSAPDRGGVTRPSALDRLPKPLERGGSAVSPFSWIAD
jgi:hypothetical protein